jgi:hypothetical protein
MTLSFYGNYFLNCWVKGDDVLTKAQLDIALSKSLITQEEYDYIIAQPREA